MLGWWITIIAVDDIDRNTLPPPSKRPVLAKWEAGVDGIAWLDKLVKAGRATQLRRDGYPNRFQAKAEDVLPLLTNGGVKPPSDGLWVFGIDEGEEYAQPPGWMGQIEIDSNAVAACDPNQVLVIDAWDQS